MRRDLMRAEAGEIQGYMPTLSIAGGDDEYGVFGSFADRLQYAICSADQHLHDLIQHTARQPGVGHSTCAGFDASIPKPPPSGEGGELPYQMLNA